VDRRDLVMPDNIKVIGEYPVTVKLHNDVTAQVTLEIKAAEAA